MLQVIDRSATAINPDLGNSDLQSRGRGCKGPQECAVNSKEKGGQCAQRSGGRPRRNFGEVSFSRLRLTASYTGHDVPVSRFRYLSPRDYRTPGEDLDSARSVWPNEILIFDKAPRSRRTPAPVLSASPSAFFPISRSCVSFEILNIAGNAVQRRGEISRNGRTDSSCESFKAARRSSCILMLKETSFRKVRYARLHRKLFG